MIYNVLRTAIKRHLDETKLLINQLTNQIVIREPVQPGRPLGEIILHMIRSIEFYLRGLTTNHWEPLPYNITTYRSAQDIKNLYEDVVQKAKNYLENLPPSVLNELLEGFSRPATKAEVLLEMLEHSIHHRGQILVYLRLLGLEPAKIPYIV